MLNLNHSLSEYVTFAVNVGTIHLVLFWPRG